MVESTAVPVITVKELKFAIDACATATKRAQESKGAEEIKKAAMTGIFERALGVKSLDDVTPLSPDEIAKIVRRRFKKGEFQLQGFDDVEVLIAVIQKSQERRNISWKDAFIARCGAAAAAEVEKNTPVSYSYKAVKVLAPGL